MDRQSSHRTGIRQGGRGARTAVFLVLAAGLALSASGCGLIKRFGGGSSGNASSIQDQQVLHLDQFVVNLADPGADAFLRVGIDVGIPADSKAITESGPDPATVGLLRDTILRIVTTRTSGDLLTPQGKQQLKTLILDAIQKRDPSLHATAIYFTEFLVQR